jgi:hypothetical protein
MKIHSIYDAPEYADRYTVYLKGRGSLDVQDRKRVRMCLGMSGQPRHPQGICMHGTGVVGRHNGRKIGLADLPIECQKVLEDYGYHI